MNTIKIIPNKGIKLLLLALVLFSAKANAQVVSFGMFHNSELNSSGSGSDDLNDGAAASDVPQVGEFKEGGIIFYIFQNGDPGYVVGETHGLVCAIQDQSTAIQWHNGSFTTTGVTATGIGAGQTNTTAIINKQGAGTYAASVCDDYSVTIGATTYDDWFLPSKDELYVMYQNKGTIETTALANGGSVFAIGDAYYWSSTEVDTNDAWQQDFNDEYMLYGGKHYTDRVRAIRAF